MCKLSVLGAEKRRGIVCAHGAAQRLRHAVSRITLRAMAQQTRKARPKGLQKTQNVSARLAPGEHAALGVLLKKRAAEMEARNEPGDDSFVGWLRAVIREKAAAAGITVELAAAPGESKRAKGGRS